MDVKEKLPKNGVMVFRFNSIIEKKAVKHVNMFSTMHSGKLIDSGNKHRLTDETVLKLDKVVD